jgi:hypothetical protein
MDFFSSWNLSTNLFFGFIQIFSQISHPSRSPLTSPLKIESYIAILKQLENPINFVFQKISQFSEKLNLLVLPTHKQKKIQWTNFKILYWHWEDRIY